jgi:hypothetical protein
MVDIWDVLYNDVEDFGALNLSPSLPHTLEDGLPEDKQGQALRCRDFILYFYKLTIIDRIDI